jgi:hypothetical protein
MVESQFSKLIVASSNLAARFYRALLKFESKEYVLIALFLFLSSVMLLSIGRIGERVAVT